MKFDEKYIGKTAEANEPDKEKIKDKVVISDEAFSIGELLEDIRTELRRSSII